MTPLLLHVFPTFAVGGAQVRFTTVANRFGRHWRHAIVALDGVTDCSARLSPQLDVSWPDITIRKGDLAGNVRAIRGLLRRLRPDVMVTSNWGAIEWAIANAWPLVRHVHTEDGFGPEERAIQLPRRVWTRRLVLRRSAVVLPSRVLLDIAQTRWRLPQRRLHYIPNGVDLSRFTTSVRADAAPVIGIVAALRAEKNVGRLVRATAQLDPRVRLEVVGDGPERPALEALAASLGIAGRVAFVGQQADPAPWYARWTVFALSSDTEQMPLSVLEAMAAGLPVASTDVGDVRSMLNAANAPFVCAPDDTALAASLRTLTTDAGLARHIGGANRLKAETTFDQEAMFAAYGRVYMGEFALP